MWLCKHNTNVNQSDPASDSALCSPVCLFLRILGRCTFSLDIFGSSSLLRFSLFLVIIPFSSCQPIHRIQTLLDFPKRQLIHGHWMYLTTENPRWCCQRRWDGHLQCVTDQQKTDFHSSSSSIAIPIITPPAVWNFPCLLSIKALTIASTPYIHV